MAPPLDLWRKNHSPRLALEYDYDSRVAEQTLPPALPVIVAHGKGAYNHARRAAVIALKKADHRIRRSVSHVSVAEMPIEDLIAKYAVTHVGGRRRRSQFGKKRSLLENITRRKSDEPHPLHRRKAARHQIAASKPIETQPHFPICHIARLKTHGLTSKPFRAWPATFASKA